MDNRSSADLSQPSHLYLKLALPGMARDVIESGKSPVESLKTNYMKLVTNDEGTKPLLNSPLGGACINVLFM